MQVQHYKVVVRNNVGKDGRLSKRFILMIHWPTWEDIADYECHVRIKDTTYVSHTSYAQYS